MSKGWGTTAVQLNRNQATNLTMIMGGVYLAYSAYFLSLDFTVVYTVMNIIMVLLYAGLGITYFRSCHANIKKIDTNLAFMARNEENIMKDSLLIKRSMLIGIMIGTVLFCISKMFDYGVNNNLGD
jgi:hypothetical protein